MDVFRAVATVMVITAVLLVISGVIGVFLADHVLLVDWFNVNVAGHNMSLDWLYVFLFITFIGAGYWFTRASFDGVFP